MAETAPVGCGLGRFVRSRLFRAVSTAGLGAVGYGGSMRIVLQRVSSAQVSVLPEDGGEPEVVGAIEGPGLLALVGVTHGDGPAEAAKLAEKTWRLRLLDGERSCADLDAPILAVSQFTLYGDARKGRRPSWSAAAPGPASEPIVDAYVQALRDLGATVATGRFGAHMRVQLTNDGPVTLILDTADL